MLLINENDVQKLLPMERALECVETSLLAQHKGQALNRSRQRILIPHISLHYLAAALIEQGLLGIKVYTATRSDFHFLVVLFESPGGKPLALIEADHLGRLRTGAASGIATRLMARADATRLGVIGAGRQSRTQIEAISLVRPIREVRVFSRNEQHRKAFANEMTQQLGSTVMASDSAEEVVRWADIVVTATTSNQPVIFGEWLRPGTHVNAVGANAANRRELNEPAIAKASILAVDSLEQAKQESGDLIEGLVGRTGGWESVTELHNILANTKPGRTSPEEITVFKSNGIAIWDVAAAGFVYQQACRLERGTRINFGTGA
jgi:ornithine cyclodeaminase/alanine dehydrogenase-like protein (mu-crystallin family)